MNERTAKLLNSVARRFNLDARLLRKDWIRLSAKRKAALRRKFQTAADRLELGGRTFRADGSPTRRSHVVVNVETGR